MNPRRFDFDDVDVESVDVRPVSEDKMTISFTGVQLYDILDQIDEDELREYLGV